MPSFPHFLPFERTFVNQMVKMWANTFLLWTCTVLLLPAANADDNSHVVGDLIFIKGAVARGAVCLDGSPPAYYFDRGHGKGANSWLIDFDGGVWCRNISDCAHRARTVLGSSLELTPQANFTGKLSFRAEENPDFFNWNRVRVPYCDGASFAGEGEDKASGLYFRGHRIYKALMDDLMLRGMRHANQALLFGGSAGAFAAIIHCDNFSSLFPTTTRVKCVSDAGLFLDTTDLDGEHRMRSFVEDVVSLHGVHASLPHKCTNRLGPVSCFFPQHLINYVNTPLFLLNAAYDTAQIQYGVASDKADPHEYWRACKLNITFCSPSQLHVYQSFRNFMVNAVKGFGAIKHNGVFINSCFVHSQANIQVAWLSKNPPRIDEMGISVAVGNWYFNRSRVLKIDCPYPCDKTCINE